MYIEKNQTLKIDFCELVKKKDLAFVQVVVVAAAVVVVVVVLVAVVEL